MDHIYYNIHNLEYNSNYIKKKRKKWDKNNINTYIKIMSKYEIIRNTRKKWDLNPKKKIIFFLHFKLKPYKKKKFWK
tara:strand:+ start:6240 stop:6470 length:231 start_codon:yes stop_codon:yes gene_type:complete